MVAAPFPPTGTIAAGGAMRPIDLELPPEPAGVVIVLGRATPVERYLAYGLRAAGFATLAVEHGRDDDVARIAAAIIDAIGWIHSRHDLGALPIGVSAAGTAATAALVAATRADVEAIVARGARPELLGPALSSVQTPTLFVVGAHDPAGLTAIRRAVPLMPAATLDVIDGAGSRLVEPGALDQLVDRAIEFFHGNLARSAIVAGPLWTS